MKKTYRFKAFTLVEIMIATAIIVMLAAATLAGFSVNRNRQLLLTGAEKIKSALQQAQSYAKHPRSQDYRPLYYAVRFIEVYNSEDEKTELVLESWIFSDEDNNGVPDTEDRISRTNLTPITIQSEANIKVPGDPSDKWQKITLQDGLLLGYRVDDPLRIIAYLPDDDLISEPGYIKEGWVKVVFDDTDIEEAYNEYFSGQKIHPVIYFLNEGAKIEIRMDY